MTNLFSSFDPNVRVFSAVVRLNWFSALLVIFILPQIFWVTGSQVRKAVNLLAAYLEDELNAVFGLLVLPGTVFMFVSLFMFVLFSNFMGLFPYIFTRTSHLVMTLALALPLWLGGIIWALIFQFNSVLAHFVPSGTPGPLIPLIVLIESVRNIIRPGTLSIRLAANMVAGHLLLTLLGSQGAGVGSTVLVFLIVGLVLLLILEVGVACIQAYVFTILSSLYLNEIRSAGFNKSISK